MFHSNNYLFELPQFSEDIKQGSYDLPTTTHNSPGSLKSKSITFEDSPFNCSFDEGTQTGQAQTIWDASINYLQSALKQFAESSKGFNDQSLYDFVNDKQTLNEQNVQQMILTNGNLKIQQKHEFISALQNENELKDLMRQLSNLFNQNIFHEITYVIFKIWQKKNQNQKINCQTYQNEDFIVPHFDCFWGYADEEVPKISYSPYFQQKTYDDVIREALKCSEQIAEEIYFDKKIKLLNLREFNKESKQELQVASLFSQFFSKLTKSVYLSSEGFFNQPSVEEDMVEQFNQDFDFEFDMNSVCALDEMKQTNNRFVRSFSQCLEDDDEDFEFNCLGDKKRKLQ